MDFDNDYEQFKDQIFELEDKLRIFIDGSFQKLQSSSQALNLLKKFESFNIPCMKVCRKCHLTDLHLFTLYKDVVADKYSQILKTYGKEVENIKRMYQRLSEEPPVSRDMPPICGKIMWARQLFRRIHEPMTIFQKNSPEILKVSSFLPSL